MQVGSWVSKESKSSVQLLCLPSLWGMSILFISIVTSVLYTLQIVCETLHAKQFNNFLKSQPFNAISCATVQNWNALVIYNLFLFFFHQRTTEFYSLTYIVSCQKYIIPWQWIRHLCPDLISPSISHSSVLSSLCLPLLLMWLLSFSVHLSYSSLRCAVHLSHSFCQPPKSTSFGLKGLLTRFFPKHKTLC